ncbi:DUF7282 domain-containing protein [Haloarcula litorea]|uniref:DUF7282 domain-containing protein n=1 Tax=Haloarcula litorea TaxID=3032579 RepID=UPI0023E79C12|nr:CARDB domain-containing protein [Halomicroarcula sp. GDY20]
MTQTKLIALALALVAVGGVTGVTGTQVAPVAGNDEEPLPGAGNQPTATAFEVSNLSAPDSVAANGTVTAVATVSNPTDGERTESVAFRIGGAVADQKPVRLAAGESRTVSFTANTSGLEAGEYVHGVFAAEDGAVGTITVSESFTLDSLEAPANATVGDTVTVNATVSNPNDFTANQSVEFRVGGTLVAEQPLSLAAGESASVTLDLSTEGAAPGEYVHGAFTRDGGEFATLTLEPAPPETATVTFDDQASNGTTVVVRNVSLPADGYVAIHDETLLQGETVDSVVGVSGYLEAGVHENVTVTLFEVPGTEFDDPGLTSSQALIAMPHVESGDNQTYDFVRTNGTEDGPFTVDGQAVVDTAIVTVADDGGEEPTETATEEPTETATEEPTETATPGETDTETPEETAAPTGTETGTPA